MKKHLYIYIALQAAVAYGAAAPQKHPVTKKVYHRFDDATIIQYADKDADIMATHIPRDGVYTAFKLSHLNGPALFSPKRHYNALREKYNVQQKEKLSSTTPATE